MNIKPYPVCLFFFNRPELVNPALNALSESSKNFNIHLYIFVDGPRNDSDKELVKKTIDRINEYDFINFKVVNIKKNQLNNGLAKSVIFGVNKVIKKYGNVIVVEDDLEVSKNFIPFMIDSLSKYKDKENVGSISGFTFAIKPKSKEDAYFHPRPNSWGWATWEDRWAMVNWDVDNNYLKKIMYSKKSFNRLGEDMDRMLQGYLSKRIDSWAIRWALCHWNLNWVALSPYKSKIINNGFGDNFATNTIVKNNFFVNLDKSNYDYPFNLPCEIEIIPRNLKIVNKYNSNLIRLIQKYSPSWFWNYTCKIIYYFY